MSQSTEELQQLISAHPFVTLTDSQTLYPSHTGTGIPLLSVKTPLCEAVIALNGAQLMSFRPTGGDELLWVSPNCQFSSGSSLRGGIPLCLPWFGPHPTDSTRPNHGIARTAQWQLIAAGQAEDGSCSLTMRYQHQADDRFEYDFAAELTLQLGTEPSLSLSLTNHSDQPFDASWVMHTYFAIDDIAKAEVLGLDGRDYSDKVAGGKTFTQHGSVTFNGEVDRVYTDIQAPVTLADRRQIHVDGENCPSVVVWNTGAELAAKVGDIGAGNHTGYVCVERGACLNDTWQVAPGGTRQARMTLIAQ